MIKYKCLSCSKYYSNKFDEKLKKRFKNTFQFSDNDINKFILLLRKVADPYEYMDDWEKFNEITYRLHLSTCRLHACKKSLQSIWNKKKLGGYYDLYLSLR